jgi:hypothetical protein
MEINFCGLSMQVTNIPQKFSDSIVHIIVHGVWLLSQLRYSEGMPTEIYMHGDHTWSIQSTSESTFNLDRVHVNATV